MSLSNVTQPAANQANHRSTPSRKYVHLVGDEAVARADADPEVVRREGAEPVEQVRKDVARVEQAAGLRVVGELRRRPAPTRRILKFSDMSG